MTTPTEPRRLNWAALIEAFLIGALAAVLLSKASRGVLDFYIHPRYAPLVIACGIVLLLVAGARLRGLWATPEPLIGRRTGYALLLVPVLLGSVVPPRSLGSGALGAGGLNLDVNAAAQGQGNTATWNLLQWAAALSVRTDLDAAPVDVVGFVHHDPERPLEGFFVARYVVTCCAADGAGVGLPVVWPNGTALTADSWVRVQGTLGRSVIAGREEPTLIATRVEPVAQPSPPYLYP